MIIYHPTRRQKVLEEIGVDVITFSLNRALLVEKLAFNNFFINILK